MSGFEENNMQTRKGDEHRGDVPSSRLPKKKNEDQVKLSQLKATRPKNSWLPIDDGADWIDALSVF